MKWWLLRLLLPLQRQLHPLLLLKQEGVKLIIFSKPFFPSFLLPKKLKVMYLLRKVNNLKEQYCYNIFNSTHYKVTNT